MVLRRSVRFPIVSTLEVAGVDLDSPGHTYEKAVGTRPAHHKEVTMAGGIRKLLTSAVVAKIVQEARKPQNQAKLKKAVADFQNKRRGGNRPGGTTRY